MWLYIGLQKFSETKCVLSPWQIVKKITVTSCHKTFDRMSDLEGENDVYRPSTWHDSCSKIKMKVFGK